MKKIILGTLLLFMAASAYCQDVITKQPLTPQQYLKKSKEQKTAAWVLLGTGVVLIPIGTTVAVNDLNIDVWGTGTTEKESSLGPALFFGGLSLAIGSIPLFIAGARNKGKVRAVSANLKLENAHFMQPGTLTAYPSLAIKVRL
jgi:hypothetical protein